MGVKSPSIRIIMLRNKKQCDLNITSDFTKYPRDAVVDDSLNPRCSCDIGTQQCPVDAFYPPVKEKQVENTNKSFNINVTKKYNCTPRCNK